MASHTITGSIGGTFTAGFGTVTPATSSPTQVSPVVGTLMAHATLTLSIPPPSIPRPNLRTTAGISVVMPTPAVVRGIPRVPKDWAKLGATGHALSGGGHLSAFQDPDPVWGGAGWVVAPPPVAASQFVRWTVRDLPDPSTYPNAQYPLGEHAAEDGTSGYIDGTRAWYSSGGSSYEIAWFTRWPFKPTVKAYTHFGSKGKMVSVDRALHFSPTSVAHLWADFGTILTPPFTLLWVGILTNFPSKNYFNYVLDAGTDFTGYLTEAQMAAIYAGGVAGDIALPGEAYGYRTGLRVGASQAQIFNDPVPTTRIARVPFTDNLKPKMLVMVVNGSNSYMLVWDGSVARDQQQRITLANHGSQRNMVMGRQNGLISPLAAASMIAFEMRAWNGALSYEELQAQYAQLSSTWQFNLYT